MLVIFFFWYVLEDEENLKYVMEKVVWFLVLSSVSSFVIGVS